MEVRLITSPVELNNFVATAWGGQFLQSWEWGDFQASQGHKVWRFGVYDQSELLASAQIILHNLPFSRAYLYAPHGPVFTRQLSDERKEKIIKLFLSKARDITIATAQRHEFFFRLEPRLTKEDLGNFFFNLGLKKTNAVQPQDTQIIDLNRDPAELLSGMHPKTRYNIRLAERHGVTVKLAEQPDELDNFLQLLKITARRDGFRIHSDNYYRQMLNIFGQTDIADQLKLTIKLFFACQNKNILAAGLFSFFGDRAVYLHGASSQEKKEIMAPYLLHWQVMNQIRTYGYTKYDLYGVKPAQRTLTAHDRENQWQGITRFKKGFGGQEVNYVGAWDWVYDKMWYKIYQLAKRFL